MKSKRPSRIRPHSGEPAVLARLSRPSGPGALVLNLAHPHAAALSNAWPGPVYWVAPHPFPAAGTGAEGIEGAWLHEGDIQVCLNGGITRRLWPSGQPFAQWPRVLATILSQQLQRNNNPKKQP